VEIGIIKHWNLEFDNFVGSNSILPEDIPGCELDAIDGRFLPDAVCPPDSVRWPSDSYRLRVEAIDEALVESRPAEGELEFVVNYAPETRLRRDATWPNYSEPGSGGARLRLAEGDTIPLASYVSFDMVGNDKTTDTVFPALYGDLCCDIIQNDSTVTLQANYDFVSDRGRFITTRSTQRSAPFRAPPGSGEPDSIGFQVGPFHYEVEFVARDEHGRTDRTPDKFVFSAGFQPRVLSTTPAHGDSLVLWGALESPWPGSLAASRKQATRWWTGNEWLDDPARCRDPAECAEVSGFLFSFRGEFRGSAHPRENGVTIRSWQFENVGENDPENLFRNGWESQGLNQWIATESTPDVWSWADEAALEVFVPIQLWFQLASYEPCGGEFPECNELFEEQRRQGKFLARQLGAQRMSLWARNTRDGDSWPIYRGVRFDPQAREFIPIGSGGRRSHPVVVDWGIWIGSDTDADGAIDRFWPDFDLCHYD
jgi:hypothetical protein